MKKIKIPIIIILMSLWSNAYSQHEIKTNVLGLMQSDFNISYEYILNKKNSLNLTLSYRYLPRSKNDTFNLILRVKDSKAVSLEYHIYLQKKDSIATGFWLAPYLSYRDWTVPQFVIFSLFNIILPNDENCTGFRSRSFSLGLSFGKKFIFSHFTYGFYLGLGISPYRYTNVICDGKPQSKYGSSSHDIKLSLPRMGINFAYRFGR